MSRRAKTKVQLNLRLPADGKSVIEAAAAYLGQSVSDYAVATLVQNARDVLQQHHVLLEAAKRYKRHFG